MRPIRLIVNGKRKQISDVPPWVSLLDWLREDQGLCGTKEGCNEGDCGACTVAIRDLGPDGDLRTRAVNACIQFLPTLDGKEVVTVEGLARAGLHPVQSALADAHGSQCGFCTPGFVMSLWAARENRVEPSKQAVCDALAGNLCRCTGYGPILSAGQEALVQQPEDAPEAHNRLRLLAADLGGDFVYEAGGVRFIAPENADQLAKALIAHPEATILAGATDIGLWTTKKLWRPKTLISLARAADLDRVEREPGGVRIFAAVTHARAMEALSARADFNELWRRFASTQIRAVGTLCGNIANGSPIGDGPPALIAVGAVVRLRRGAALREMPLEDYFVAYGKQDRAPGEFVESVFVPDPELNERVRAYKISKRFDQDISAVCGVINVVEEGGVIQSARIAFGGMAATPKRAAQAESVLIGAAFEQESFDRAAEALTQDFQPIDDMRASAAYRMQVAQDLIRKFWLEESGQAMRLAAIAEVSA